MEEFVRIVMLLLIGAVLIYYVCLILLVLHNIYKAKQYSNQHTKDFLLTKCFCTICYVITLGIVEWLYYNRTDMNLIITVLFIIIFVISAVGAKYILIYSDIYTLK